MNVGLALEIDAELDASLSSVVAETATRLEEFFRCRDYGPDLCNIFIGVILTGPSSERFHPVRKPTYKKLLKFNNRIINQKMELPNVLQYDFKPDYGNFTKLNSDQARLQFWDSVVASTAVLDNQRRHFPDFDLDRFRKDLRACLTTDRPE